jgi:SAM-dependent methyltransferase
MGAMDEQRWALDGAQAGRVHDALWTHGDYTRVAERLTALSTAVVEAADIRGGQDVLDIGAGAGNTPVDAASAGARVVAGDLSGDLFDACRRRAEGAGVAVDWIEINPEQLPLPAASIDRVLSAAGGPLTFAPNPARVAGELARVLRPGGLAVLASWTRDGLAGQVSAVIARYLPAPPPGGADPWTWAEEASVLALLAPLRFDVGLRRADVSVTARSASDLVEFMAAYHGPTITARQLVADRWPALRDELVSLYDDHAPASATHGFAVEQEYCWSAHARLSPTPTPMGRKRGSERRRQRRSTSGQPSGSPPWEGDADPTDG